MKSWLFQKLKSIMKGKNPQAGSIQITFAERVEQVMKEEKDYTPLYKYDQIEHLSEDERINYLKEIILNYLQTKRKIEEKRQIM